MSVNLKIKPVQAGGEMEVQVNIDCSATVEELKEKVSAQVNIPAKNIRLEPWPHCYGVCSGVS